MDGPSGRSEALMAAWYGSADSAITANHILAPHRERALQRIRGQRTVLAIQDGSDRNFARRPGCDGLQVIGTNQTRASTLGLHLHATLAVTDTGLPLGVLRLGFDPLKKPAKTVAAGTKSRRWLHGIRGHRRRRPRSGRQDPRDHGLRSGGGLLRTVRSPAPAPAGRGAGAGPARSGLGAPSPETVRCHAGRPVRRSDRHRDRRPDRAPEIARETGPPGAAQARGPLRTPTSSFDPAVDPGGQGSHVRLDGPSGRNPPARRRESGAVVPAHHAPGAHRPASRRGGRP